MCRIAGIASPSLSLAEMQHAVAAMCHVQRHGGPDGEGLFTDDRAGVVLGHRRLALIDLAATGHQPMQNAGGRFTITYNGELYNFRELKAELEGEGFVFRSTSDTEVVLAAFATWGPAAFARFNGMFAFALFDKGTGLLYLVRDGMGIKPLYYHHSRKGIVFASEVRAFYQLPHPPDEHPHWPVYFMAYGHLPEPVTTLKNVLPLAKGTALCYNTLTGSITTEKFDTRNFIEKEESREKALGQVAAGLRAAVSRHLLADAPIGVLLSGGVDSSIIALAAAEKKGGELNTLSINFREKAYSEKAFQEKVQGLIGSRHHQYRLTEQEFHYHLPDVLEAADLPCSDGINTWFISRFAAQHGIKAVLSGLGGDELFGGYPSFRRMRSATWLQGLSGAGLRSMRYARDKKLRRLAYLSLPGVAGQYLFLRGHFSPPTIARYLEMAEEEVWQLLENEPRLPGNNHLTLANQASWMELNLYMQNQLLRDTDVMSMAHGVEVRVPLLDKEFMKTAMHIRSAVKYSGPNAKGLLVDAFRNHLPREVWDRKKMGFSFPFTEWMKGDEWVRSRLSGGSRTAVNLMKQFDRGGLHWSGLMCLLVLRTHHYAKPRTFLNA
ncbi:asparagine synthase (glutamine-hydrolyzing) [Flavisolibacter sp. BT320]|nr:asparagine synthase (glutamine-hydrolyzing) [Flavisolibacter longurius]